MSDPRAGGWLSGLILGVVSGLGTLSLGTVGLAILVISVGLIIWKGPRGLAGAGLLTGVGLIWSVLLARVGLDCTVLAGPGEGCEGGNIWGWVAAAVVLFVGGLVGSALALQRSRR